MTKIDRRRFIQTSSWLVGGLCLSPFLQSCQPKRIEFGWVTDVHYALAKVKWDRYFNESKEKLSEAILLYNRLNLDFAIETGDFKDENAEPDKTKTRQYLRDIEAVFNQFKGPRYHVLGNHDVDSLSKKEFQEVIRNTGIPPEHTYYTFLNKGWRFIVLDACFRNDGVAYDNNNFDWFDTAIPSVQLQWLEDELRHSDEPVCIFVHQPLDDTGQLFVNNSEEVRAVFESSGKVLAVFQGHRHEGDYKQINGIHYITQKAMVDYSGMTNSSYSVVELTPEGQINIKGYRRAESRILHAEELIKNDQL
ncbi:MAG: metallophosphoesterase [Carboxylicivirga sp.]|jgi:alkaline phosphatase|nr:metallophosphoesterase [Carboxylicivirga sp.]